MALLNSKRLSVIILLPLVMTLAIQGLASANQYGIRYWGNLIYGNISSIEVPSSSEQPANAYAFYLHRSGVAGTTTSGNGQIQAGWVTTGQHEELDTCGSTNSATYEFVEVINTSGGVTCSLFNQESYPTDYNFNVFENTNGWNDKINGVVDPNGPYHPGIPYGYGFVGGESYVASGSAIAGTCYGNGPSQWEIYTALNSGGSGDTLVTPNSNTTTNVTGGWVIGDAPSPLCDSIP